MIFTAASDGSFDLGGRIIRCALGPGGVVAATEKREGDGKSPLGVWPLRRALYRADRGPAPRSALPLTAIGPEDGWCDAPDDPNYNRPVTLPYPASAEHMWRADGLYDIVVILGHNDDPPVPGFGSAIFLHLAKPDFAPTQGCVAIARADMEAFLAMAQPGDAVAIVER
ncbi:MAG: L,D-transpeptidase family protein [Phenylobacterium sp.]|uniref:L,D-transpeptidase family protein n=1 Tax=Phenylobacterium sp. TaxID=1871053 RepID=UPI002735B728|nr:L,D-transpeptidase family protein [Phenylobacterium sp.]MDP3175422.1 L,D-transpeptidase family protein [Phenylobacterium sp.]